MKLTISILLLAAFAVLLRADSPAGPPRGRTALRGRRTESRTLREGAGRT